MPFVALAKKGIVYPAFVRSNPLRFEWHATKLPTITRNINKTMYYVYLLQSLKCPKKFYTGFSTELRNRFKDHNTGNSPHTKKFRPWKIIFYCAFEDKTTALNFERYLKTSSGIAFRNKRLINYHK